ncbi:DNA-binding transcriptional dual regulator, O-acetyl-L-serine-binding [Candidatus Accumulibacter aalborgensis]|uniref:DNA-binding transcriptional dual regulator, O-acetyl-L-serine-binding n=1 Tax=Candidatus Accumulibacter aalborgensis TaxID=1860102 RepID=A0A1A8Y088_9PROT|nr:HTH-type transcriptional regulator CysB [Candidatus Accumulibacter aalborgensis]SBT09733.1 DNA-binding transcriptional dual regulator, O-acetyl-L-serine-binding [Candidatus Accumulibacter aalborgensis]
MKLQQLRYLVEVARHGLNVSAAAEALFTSQPGISKQIGLLEDELGVMVFERSGKRLTAITEPGKAVLEIAERILRDAENIRRVGEEYAGGDSGSLVIATTHTQARYALPAVVKSFVERHPRVRLSLHQGNPTQIAEWTLKGEANVAIATEALDQYPQLVMLPCYQWVHCVIAPEGHPIVGDKPLSLAALARWPLITYDSAFTGRSRINKAFELAQLTPNVVLTAIDADVIKTYVSLGLGLGIIARMAFDAVRDVGLQAMAAEHLFGSNTTRIGLRRGTHIRRYEYDFIELFAPHLNRKAVDMAMAGARPDDEYQL